MQKKKQSSAACSCDICYCLLLKCFKNHLAPGAPHTLWRLLTKKKGTPLTPYWDQ